MDPTIANGKGFRRKFRTPLPVFMDIVRLCKETNDDKFNYPEYHPIDNSKNIPLELKVLFVLRILAGGIKFGDAGMQPSYVDLYLHLMEILSLRIFVDSSGHTFKTLI